MAKQEIRDRSNRFIAQERVAQASFLARAAPVGAIHPAAAYRLGPGQRAHNLTPQARESLDAYFGAPRNIAWHRHVNHGLSSQACCLNFLAPLAMQPGLLGRVIGHALGGEPLEMLPVEAGPDGDWYVGFEWIGRTDHLGEWRDGSSATRGANATSADAVVFFTRNGVRETLLIEWKYTERYGAPLGEGNDTRTRRYHDKVFHPAGPIRTDAEVRLGDFYWEPFYQLLRQQMLAFRMQQAREDGAERVRVLHISPSANRDLHKVTSSALARFGSDAFAVFQSLLVRPEDFVSRSTEEVFGPFLREPHEDLKAEAWAAYLRDRYTFLAA